jgi:hypothetical protein
MDMRWGKQRRSFLSFRPEQFLPIPGAVEGHAMALLVASVRETVMQGWTKYAQIRFADDDDWASDWAFACGSWGKIRGPIDLGSPNGFWYATDDGQGSLTLAFVFTKGPANTDTNLAMRLYGVPSDFLTTCSQQQANPGSGSFGGSDWLDGEHIDSATDLTWVIGPGVPPPVITLPEDTITAS